MVEVKYIKRAGKLHGPYYYKSVRDPDGSVRKIYLGKTNPESVTPQKKYVRKAFDISPLNILMIVTVFLFLIGLFFFFKGFPVTGQYTISVNKMVSSNAYLEVDGISQAIPLQLTKINEDWYYNITSLDLNLSTGLHTVKIIDNSETVFEQNVLVVESSQAGNETVSNDTNESTPSPPEFGAMGGDFGVQATSLTKCEEIVTPGDYVLDNSVGSAGTCFNITANNVALNCQGWTINYSQSARGHGINITGVNHTVIRNCFINQTSTTNEASYGIYSSKAYNLTINNVHVITRGTDSVWVMSSIYLSNTHNSSFSNSTINAFGADTWALYLDKSSYNLIYNITINCSSSTTAYGGVGLATAGNNNNITNNFLYALAASATSLAIAGNNNLIANNTIYTSQTDSAAIVYTPLASAGYLVKDNLLTQNIITSVNSNGLFSYDAPSIGAGYPAQNIVDNNIINNTKNAIYLENASYWNITNNVIYNSTKGIYLNKNATNILVSGGNISTVQYSLIILEYSIANVTNILLDYHMFLNNSNITFINVTFGNSSATGLAVADSRVHYDNFTINNSVQRVTDGNFTIGPNFIEIISEGLPEFNVSANLTFYNISGYNSVTARRNDSDCEATICKNLAYNALTGVATFDVTQFTNYSTLGDNCLNLSNANTWVGRISNSSLDNFNVTANISLCKQDYLLNGTSGNIAIFNLNNSGIVFDCNGSFIYGNFSVDMGPVYMMTNSTTVKNCNFWNYSAGLLAMNNVTGDKLGNVIIRDNNFTNFIGDRIKVISTQLNATNIYIINNKIFNVTINTRTGGGIYLGYSSEENAESYPLITNVLIENNTISNMYQTTATKGALGIAIIPPEGQQSKSNHTSNFTIRRNIIYNISGTTPNAHAGIYYVGSNVTVDWNNITLVNGVSILQLSSVENNTLSNNMLNNASYGIFLGYLGSVSYVNTFDNTLYNMSSCGLYIKAMNSTFSRNIVNNSLAGICLISAGNNTLDYNNLSSVVVGVWENSSVSNNTFYETNISSLKYSYVYGTIDGSGNILANTIAWYNRTLSNLSGSTYGKISIGNGIVAVNSTGLPEGFNSSANVSLSVNCNSYTKIYYNASYQTTLANIVRSGQGQVVASSGDTRCSSPGACDGITCTNNILNMNISNFSSYGIDNCVNLTDATTFGTKVSANAAQNFNISQNTVLCKQAYQFNGSIYETPILFINNSNVELDCNGAFIVGNLSTTSRPAVPGNNNNTIKNCNFWNYSSGISETSAVAGYANNGINILNNNFTNFVGQDGSINAIRFDNVTDITIANNIIANMFGGGEETSTGIVLLGRPVLRNIIVQNNTINTVTHTDGTGAAVGIMVINNDILPIDTVSNVTISDNIIINITSAIPGYSIGIGYGGSNSTIQRNNLSGVDGIGILSYGDYISFYNNSIINISSGFYLDSVGWGEDSLLFSHNIVSQNILWNNSAYAIYASNVSNLTISYNNISDGNTSIYVLDGNNINVLYNNITNCINNRTLFIKRDDGVEQQNISVIGNRIINSGGTTIRNASYVYFINNTVDNSLDTFSNSGYNTGVLFNGVPVMQHVLIQGNNISNVALPSGNGGFGILTLSALYFLTSSRDSVNNVTIINNVVKNATYSGISFIGKNVNISYNNITYSAKGIAIGGNGINSIYKNFINNASYGILIGESAYNIPTYNYSVIDNVIPNASIYGISTYNLTNSSFISNVVNGSHIGLFLNHSGNNTFLYNNFTSFKVGVSEVNSYMVNYYYSNNISNAGVYDYAFGSVELKSNGQIDVETIAWFKDQLNNLSGSPFDNIVVGGKRVAVNSSGLPLQWNSSANISLNNVGCSFFNIYYNSSYMTSRNDIKNYGISVATTSNINCNSPGRCSDISCSGSILTFNVSNFSSYAIDTCVNLSDSTSWDGRVRQSSNQFIINGSSTLCRQIYSTSLSSAERFINFNGTDNSANITLDCNSATLRLDSTANSNDGIFLWKGNNLTVKNCVINGFTNGIRKEYNAGNATLQIYNNTVINGTFSGINIIDGFWHNSLVENNIISNISSTSTSSLGSAISFGNSWIANNFIVKNVSVKNNVIYNITCLTSNCLGNTAVFLGDDNSYLLSIDNANVSYNNISLMLTTSPVGQAGAIQVASNSSFIYKNNISNINSSGLNSDISAFGILVFGGVISSSSLIAENIITNLYGQEDYSSLLYSVVSTGCDIRNNTLMNSVAYGIKMSDVVYFNIFNNTLLNLTKGIYFDYFTNSNFYSNIIRNSSKITTGLIQNSDNSYFSNNSFDNFGVSASQKKGLTIRNSFNTSFLGNVFIDFNDTSVLNLSRLRNVTFSHNVITNYSVEKAAVYFDSNNQYIWFTNNTINNGSSGWGGIALAFINSTNIYWYNNTINNTFNSSGGFGNFSVVTIDSEIFEPNQTEIIRQNNITNTSLISDFAKLFYFQARAVTETSALGDVSIRLFFNFNGTLTNLSLFGFVDRYTTNASGHTPAPYGISNIIPTYLVFNRTVNFSTTINTNYSAYEILMLNNLTIVANTSTKTIYVNFTANRSYIVSRGNELILDFGIPVASLSVSPSSITKGGSASVSCTGTDYTLTGITVTGTVSGAICSNLAPICTARTGCRATCSGTASPASTETITCTGTDSDGHSESSSVTLTVSDNTDSGGGPPPPPPPPPASPHVQMVAPSRGNLSLIQFPEGTLKFYYTDEEGVMKPHLDLSFDVSSLAYYKPVSSTYVPWFIYVLAIITLIIITFVGTTVTENRGEIADRFRHLRRK